MDGMVRCDSVDVQFRGAKNSFPVVPRAAPTKITIVMNKNFAATAQGLALAIGLAGCAQQDEDFIPQKQVGFRPPPTPLVQQDLPAVDPVGTQPSPAPLNPLPDAVASAPAPDAPPPLPKQAPVPVSPAPVAPTPPPAPPKPTAPEYAKKVPGKPNQIYNPYTGAILDVTGLTPGQEVRDPRTGHTMLVP